MPTRLERITRQRLGKLEYIRGRGIEPYPHRYTPSHTNAQAAALLNQKRKSSKSLTAVTITGRVKAQRRMGKIYFLDIYDASGKLQLYIPRNQISADNLELLHNLDIGDFIGASGRLFMTKTGEPTLEVETLTLLAKSLRPLPEKWHGLHDVDTRHRQRYLDLISNPEVKRAFTLRSQIISSIRDFLNARDFLEVETPVLQPSAGGALARPFITHHHALDHDFYLRIALELYLKRLIIGGIDKVYELGRVFRNEGISTKHNPEFTMLELYQAYADYNDIMNLLEEMTSSVVSKITGGYKISFGRNTIDFKPPWPRLELRQAIADQSGIDFVQYPDANLLRMKMCEKGLEVDPGKDWPKLIDELISVYLEPELIQPTFILDYPLSMSPLAKRKPDQERVVERFEAFAGGMEIANAFTELNDPIEQRQRFVKQQKGHGKNDEQEVIDEEFLIAMEYGMPPTGGLGIGIDRIVMLLTDQQSIREVILFPHHKEKV
ncbi:MAG: lysine--tRNA ligase [Dehalococcoidia bacterium]|nr:MAG: lysine--tRNA ligase [Dehalococcoidia bacterium]